MIVYKDEKYGFYELFNEENGTLIRGDINGIDPECRSYPELLDVGIMGHCESRTYCKEAGIDCYQKGYQKDVPHMSIMEFEMIARQSSGRTFQIALGGAGDPNKHPDFVTILEICRYYKIVPNLTTSGFAINDREIEAIKKYCGAVAVSWYSRIVNGEESNFYTLHAVNRLVESGCVTNIHFVISKDTIDEAIYRLENDIFPVGINAIIFILYKPVGLGISSKQVDADDTLLKFLSLALKKHSFHVGFDTCFTSALVSLLHRDFPLCCIDACEAATFSMYIDSQCNAFPCSFGIDNENLALSLKTRTIQDVWDDMKFVEFRK